MYKYMDKREDEGRRKREAVERGPEHERGSAGRAALHPHMMREIALDFS